MSWRWPVLVVSIGFLVLVSAVPAQASQVTRVAPTPGKWAGLSSSTSCDSMASPDITETSMPDALDCAPGVTPATEAVDFKIADRHVTALAFDIVVQCHPSDTDRWSARMMRFTSASGWGYTTLGVGTSTAIPSNGLLRIAFPVEETFSYPAGTVQATFDFRGRTAKVSLFYEGTVREPGFWNHCVSQANRPSVIPVRKRA